MSQQQMPQVRISTFQAVVLLVHTVTPTAMLVIPAIAIGAAGQDAWMTTLVAWACGIVFVLLYSHMNKSNPGTPFLSYVEKRLGRAVGVIVGLLLAQYYFSTLTTIVRELIEFATDAVLLKTPLIVVGIVTVAVAIYIVSQGIEVIARAGVIVLGLSAFLFALHIVLLMHQMHIQYLFPIGEAPIQRIASGSLSSIGWFSECSLLFLIAPMLVNPSAARKVGLWGVSLSAAFLLNTVLVSILVFGPTLPGMMTYPTSSVAETIQYAFVERLDMLFIFSWISAVYMKVGVFFYGTMHCFNHVFRIQNRKPFIVVIGIFALLTAMQGWKSTSDLSEYQHTTLPPYLLSMNVALPFLLWLCLSVAKRTKRKAGKPR
ncbi:MAG: hypothetical protein K0Q59_1321 [Paenibacillus sp.]|jgi:spore germination protein KB|nr:hypothetical protein [Paenibacillus sp.]